MPTLKFCPQCGKHLTTKTIEGKQRLTCPTEKCGYVFWDNPLPVVAAIVELNDKIILARNRDWPEKVFALITGFLEKGETPENGVQREVKEELDLDTKECNFVGLYSFFEKNQVIFAYHIKAEGKITLGEELAEYREFPPEKIRTWEYGTGPALRDWLQQKLGEESTQ